jgi:dCMP deaminase
MSSPAGIPLSTKWDLRYLELVDHVAGWSKDRSTRIGAVLVKDNRVISVGFNGMPTGVSDDVEARHQRPDKYYYFEHAERNCILTAAREGIRVAGATLYTTGIPCADCARATIQSGVACITVWKRGSGLETSDRWHDSIKAGETMLKEAGVEIVEIDRTVTPILDVSGTEITGP